MREKFRKVYGFSLIIFWGVGLIIYALLSAEGTEGLWRKMISNLLVMYIIGCVGTMLNDKFFHNAKAEIVSWIIGLVISVLISAPCIKDFSSEHEVREILRSSCDIFSSKRNSYLYLNTGETIVIDSNTYFSLLGHQDCLLRVEYYPNTKIAVNITEEQSQNYENMS